MPAIPISSSARPAQSLHLRDLIPAALTTLTRRILPSSHLDSRAGLPPDTAISHPISQPVEPIHHLDRRQNTLNAIPDVFANNQDTGPSAGTVVGIVLGSVLGFILLAWLIYSLTQNGARGRGDNTSVLGVEEEIVHRRSRSPRSRRSRPRSSRPEVRQVSRSPRPQRIIVEERRTSMPPPPPAPRSIVVEERVERRVDGDDIVEVIEEHSEPRRAHRTRRNSGYRSVDPDLFAGGNYPQHKIRRYS